MPLAIFDLDNTLLSGDSDYLWGCYLCEIGVMDSDEYEARNQQFYDDYKRGELDIMAFLAFSLRPLAENDPQDLLRWRGELVTPLLTACEVEVLQRAADGRTLEEIADELHVSRATVKRHFERAYARLEVGDRAAAVAKAMRTGLVR